MKYTLLPIIIFSLLSTISINLHSQNWKVNSNQWTATDALNRTLPTWSETGNINPDKVVGIFYHSWHTDGQADGEFVNLPEFLQLHPNAMNDFNDPAWPANANYYWDEPLFGYYRTTDDWILRKHAEMLADAGVDVVFFDASNGNYSWKSSYTKILEVWGQARIDGVKTPQIAFLLPFSVTDGAREIIYEIYNDTYSQNVHPELWFMWDGKPLIMAYPEVCDNATIGDKAGLKFTANSTFYGLQVRCPSWSNNIGNLTLSVYNWNTNYQTSVAQIPVVSQTFVDYNESQPLDLQFANLPAGEYVWELSNAVEVVGVWKFIENTSTTDSYFNGTATTGDYACSIKYVSQGSYSQLTTGSYSTWQPIQMQIGFNQSTLDEISNFFTFRPGQGAYTAGPSRSDQWGWLETYPQHGFGDDGNGGFEQVTVGVAQNANDVSGGNCCSFNAPNTYSRSYTSTGWDTQPDAYLHGANFTEQWDRATVLDPEMIWVTAWNEWIFGRFENWEGCGGGAQVLNSFPDGFDSDRSRDIEPVKSWGEFGDVYYMQLTDKIRRFKGMQVPETASESNTIEMGNISNWNGVLPEFWHYEGNTFHRNHAGHGQSLTYTNNTGRNDIVLSKIVRDYDNVYFYVSTAESLTSNSDAGWMRLFIDIDRNKQTGWEGYDFVVNRQNPTSQAIIEQSTTNTWSWSQIGTVDFTVTDTVLEIAIPRSLLNITDGDALNIEFKWSDNMQDEGNIMDFYQNGDVAPGGRFNFVYTADAVQEPIVASFTVSNNNVCVNEMVNFTDNSTGTPISWAWDFDDGGSTASGTSASHAYTTAGSYTVNLDISDGTTNSTANQTITVVGGDITPGTIGGDGQTICDGDDPLPYTSVSLATSSDNILYQWQYSDNQVNWYNAVGETNTSWDLPITNFGVTSQTTYYARRAATDCSQDTLYSNNISMIVDVCTNSEVIENSKGFKIYPNPAHEYVVIINNELLITAKKVDILDFTGKTIKQLTINSEAFTIDVSNLEKGVYFIKVGSQVQKFIKD